MKRDDSLKEKIEIYLSEDLGRFYEQKDNIISRNVESKNSGKYSSYFPCEIWKVG